MPGSISEPWFQEIRLWAAEWPRVAVVYAFGPWAKRQQQPGSDLNVAIVLSDDPDENALTFATANLKAMHDSLSARLPVPVDLQVAFPGDAIAWPSVE